MRTGMYTFNSRFGTRITAYRSDQDPAIVRAVEPRHHRFKRIILFNPPHIIHHRIRHQNLEGDK
ncbi:MAG: hypothetical protein WKF30_13490 [Pyrinomonadaceae bacterium]